MCVLLMKVLGEMEFAKGWIAYLELVYSVLLMSKCNVHIALPWVMAV